MLRDYGADPSSCKESRERKKEVTGDSCGEEDEGGEDDEERDDEDIDEGSSFK